MLRIEIKEGEKIERAIKRYKRKCRDTKLLQELRKRKEYKKPSAKKREKFIQARYKEQFLIREKRKML